MRSATVIGAGVVGLATALWLQRDGRQVTLFDPDGPGEGTSYGNAGILSIGSVVPLATPGTLRKVPRMLTDPMAPLAIPLGYAPRLAPWLARFLWESRPSRVREISQALATLTLPSVDHHLTLAQHAEAGDLVRRQGCLLIYETERDFAAAAGDIALRRQAGVAFDVLGPEEIRQMVPAFGPRIARALFIPEQGHVVDPLALSQAYARNFQERGGIVRRERVKSFIIGPEGPRRVETDAGQHDIEDVVIAAGVHSRALARQLGSGVPLESERGYHLMLPDPGIELRVPMLVQGAGFGVTPMAKGLRFAGTVELGGTVAPPNWQRAEVLRRHAHRLFPGLNDAGAERWMGHRPSIPDSLPVLGRSPYHRNVFFAFGHGHIGLTLAAVSGRVIADLVAGRAPPMDVRPFRPDRF